MEKLAHYHSGITVEFDGVLKHLLVGIEFRAMVESAIRHIVHSMDSYMPVFLK